jgi:hypothetical protein
VLVTDYKLLLFSRRLKHLATPEAGNSKFGSLTVDRKVTTVAVDNAVRTK